MPLLGTLLAGIVELEPGAYVEGLAPGGAAKVVQREWFGDQAAKLTFATSQGEVRNGLVYRNEEPSLKLVQAGRPWSFDGNGSLLRLVSEAYRNRHAHLFDPYVAIHSSRIDPLPHQITAVQTRFHTLFKLLVLGGTGEPSCTEDQTAIP